MTAVAMGEGLLWVIAVAMRDRLLWKELPWVIAVAMGYRLLWKEMPWVTAVAICLSLGCVKLFRKPVDITKCCQ